MQKKELKAFISYFGQRVDFSFLGANSIIDLPLAEENGLREGATLRLVKGKKSITLGKEISSIGGQGTIYKSNDARYVVKIYNKRERTKYAERKLRKMIEFDNDNSRVCWPIDMVVTKGGSFVGLMMPYVIGKNLYSLTTNPVRVMRNYPSFNRLTQVNMILDMLSQFKYLHSFNVIVGDVKLENIMFDDSFQTTLIDMDSGQVGECPCISTTPGYDAPEVILSRGLDRIADKLPDGKYEFNTYYRDFYRTMEIERYSISVLLYRFLMNGSSPYEYKDYGKVNSEDKQYNNNELCIKKQFPYHTTDDKEKIGTEKEIWSHFPSFLKEAFVNAFSKGKRYSDDEWISMFTKYKELLESNELLKADPDCMNPFPKKSIDYADVKFEVTKKYEKSGFAMIHAVARIVKATKDENLKVHVIEIAKALADASECKIDKYKFTLVYNIGLLKKVRCESVM